MDRIPGKGFSILIVDDEEGLRHGLKNLFRKEGFAVYSLADFSQALAAADKHTIDAALLDIRLKDGKNGIHLLKALKKIEPDMVVIVITGYGSIDTAVTSMKEGAADYILKPIDNRKLLDTVYKNLEIRSLKSDNYYLRNELLNRYLSYQFITCNRELQSLLNKADKIKNNPVTVFITGESGTGKEVLARYIHFSSNRREGKFVTINCAALSESLLLSELFGHEKGSFTGAIERKIGKFEIANNGTLFLDEIGDMSIDIQAKLLRVIEESSFERVGGTKQINVDVRLITATNKDLKKEINEGKFREDLYYRINVVSFHLPPIRERKEDISLLLDHFIKKYNLRYKKKVLKFDDEAVAALTSYNWPGNVREIENIVNQAVLLSEKDVISVCSLKKSVFSGADEDRLSVDISRVKSLKETVQKIVSAYERQIIEQFLRKNDYNKSKTARSLSITRKTLAQKIEKYNLLARGLSSSDDFRPYNK